MTDSSDRAMVTGIAPPSAADQRIRDKFNLSGTVTEE